MSTRVRPAKLAVVIPDDNPRIAVRTVQSCCSSWGGYAYVIVPCSRGANLSEDWKAIVKATDPDTLVDCGVLSDEDKAEFRARDISVSQWVDWDRELFLGEALQLSALAAFGEKLKPPESDYFTVMPDVADSHPLYLPLVARWGALDDDALKRTIRRVLYEYRYLPVDHSSLIQLKEIDVSRHPEDLLLGRAPGGQTDEGQSRVLNLTELTQIGLAANAASWAEGGTPERPQLQEGYANFIVVTGEPNSVSDLALCWDLRGERLGAEPFPLWLPIDVLDGEKGEAILERAISMTNPGIRNERPLGSQLYLLSTSVGRSELETRLGTRYPEAVIGADRISDFFTGRWKFYLMEEQVPVYFEQGSTRLQRPRPREFQKFLPLLDRAAYEVDIDGLWFPQSRTVCEAIYGNRPHRVTKEGTLEHLAYTTDRAPRATLPRLILPDGWTLLTSLLEERGYDCVATQKSNLSLGQLSLLGNVGNLRALASSKVYEMLKDLSARPGEGRAFAATERKTATLSRFEQLWGRSEARTLLEWFVERRILLRGAELICPRCRLKRWYTVDRIAEVWRCDGCQEDMPIPLNPDATYWKYRVNELFAIGYDQGAIAPLLTLYLMHSSWGGSDRSGFGCYPGVELRAKEAADAPVEHLEVDLIAMRHGKLILAECKESGEPLSNPNEASRFVEQLSGLVAVADYLGASRVVSATTTSFTEELKQRAEGVLPESNALVEWWEGENLLDPYQFTLGETGRPEEWPTQYLSRVVRSLSHQA